MAQFTAKVKCFVDNTLREEGDTFEYEGVPNGNLQRVGGSSDESDEVAKPEKPRWVPKAKREVGHVGS